MVAEDVGQTDDNRLKYWRTNEFTELGPVRLASNPLDRFHLMLLLKDLRRIVTT